MYITEIIPHRVWVHTSGRQASVFGAAPWTTEAEREHWTLETRGYTFRMSNGTVGVPCAKRPTHSEAVALANRMNANTPGAPRFED